MLQTRGFALTQKLNIAICVNLVVLIMAASAPAAMVGTTTIVKNPPSNPFNAPDSALPSPWQAYQIGISTTAGELIGAVDVTINGNVLHQRWNDFDFDGVTDPTLNGAASNGRGDSHLTAPAGSPFGAPAMETNSKTGSPLTSTPGVTEYGLGNLSGAWAILVPGTTANLAYLVFNPNDIPNLDIRVKAATPTGMPILTLSGSDTLTGNDGCLGCVPPMAGDDVIDNVNSAVPGLVERQLTIQNPIGGGPLSLSNLVFNSFTPPPGGSGTGPANPASVDSAARKFTWNTVGSPLGSYKWIYTAQNTYGSDFGSITVNITVPEPAACSLLALAFAALPTRRRHRREGEAPAEPAPLPHRLSRSFALPTKLMSRKLSIAPCLSLSALVLVSSAHAAVIGTATLVKQPPGSPFLAPDGALPAPWVSYQIGIATTAGELIGAVDVTVNGNVLHQRWTATDFDGVIDPTPQSPQTADGRGDSHLTAPAGSPFGFGPTETNSKTGSPIPNDPNGSNFYGVGNLAGAWGILSPSQTANIAYLVFRSDNLQNLQIIVKAATPTGELLFSPRGTELTTIDFFIPEPSTVTLLSIAFIAGAVSSRRRRREGEAPAEPALAQRLSRSFAHPTKLMSRKLVIAFCVNISVLLISCSAHAAVVGTATLVKNPPGSPFLSPEFGMPPPWVSYQLGLATTPASSSALLMSPLMVTCCISVGSIMGCSAVTRAAAWLN